MTVESIFKLINKLFEKKRKPAPKVPAMLITVGAGARPGLSTIQSSGNIVKKMNEMGFDTGAAPDGTQNMGVALAVAVVEEVFRALREDAKVQISIAPGESMIYTSGANAGGPLIGIGSNMNFVAGEGVIQ